MSPESVKKKLNCWEYKACGVDKPGSGFKCPAYPDMGRVCWSVAGTMCGGEAQGVYAKKIDSCSNCSFYKLLMDVKDS